jgi:phosphatidylglycerol:prolipoprotein diacylglycerol transferase
MHPKLFGTGPFDLLGLHIPALTLYTYGVLMAAAFLVGLWVAAREGEKSGLDANKVTDLAVYVLIAGLVGARILLVVVDWRLYSAHPRELWGVLQSGGVFYGGLLAALPVAWWYTRRHKLDAWRTADVLAPGVVIGQAIGRIGCFAAGCCYGKPANVPWAVTFKDMTAARQVGTPVDIPLHPTQLYESAACFVIFGALLWIARHKRFHGQVAVTYIVLYSIARFVVEFFRGDTVRGFVFGGVLSTSQAIAVVFLLGAAAVTPALLKKERITPPATA